MGHGHFVVFFFLNKKIFIRFCTHGAMITLSGFFLNNIFFIFFLLSFLFFILCFIFVISFFFDRQRWATILLPNFKLHLSFISASTISLLIITINSWGKYLLFIKLFTVHNNYLPLIKTFTVNNNYLPLIKLFTVNYNCLTSIEIFTVNKIIYH